MSGVVPGRAAWKSWWPWRRMSTVTGSPRSRAMETSRRPERPGVVVGEAREQQACLLFLQLLDQGFEVVAICHRISFPGFVVHERTG